MPSLPVAVVVPLRNEVDALPRLWESLLEQTRPPQEIVLVDGGSTDGTSALARELTRGDSRVAIVEAGPATPGRGRNVGVKVARSEWIAFTDGGIRLDRRWLEALVDVVRRDPDVRVVYGHYQPVTDTFLKKCAALAYIPPLRETPSGRMRGPSIASSLVHRSAWETAGGFPDLRSNEDLLFMSRLEELGWRTGWAPGAVASWDIPASLGATFRRFVLYSFHSAMAGQQRHWHYGVARQYAAAVPFIVLAVIGSRRWMALPVAGLAARVLRSIWRHREGRTLGWALNPFQIVGVAVVLATTDTATFVGWARAACARARPGRLGGRTAMAIATNPGGN